MHHLSPVRWCDACLIRYITGSRMLMLGDAMSIFARSVRAPSGNSPFSIRSNRSRFSVDRAVAIRAVLARLVQRAAMRAHFLGRQIADIRLAVLDELNRPIVELLEIIRRVEQPVFPIAAEPADVVDDRIDVLLLFLRRVRVVEPQVELAAVLLREPEVQADALGMADVQIAVRLRRKPRMHAPAVLAGGPVGVDDLLDEVAGGFSPRDSSVDGGVVVAAISIPLLRLPPADRADDHEPARSRSM